MATVAPISPPWIPEDDLLLKNAIEAGASLEALAKGAVQFSRRFTFRELRDRWHSLLYDPDISAQASARMVELEHSGSNPSLKFNRLDNSKGSGKGPEKRKIGSIRREYYAMRKRTRSELFYSSDLGFLPEPNLHDCGEHGGDFQEHLTLDNEPRDGNSILGGCISNNFELQETDLDILRHVFPETLVDMSATTAVDNTGNAFNAGCQNQVEDNHPNEIARKNSLYGFSEDVSSIRNNDRGSFEPISEHKGAACMLEDNSGNFEKCMVVEEIRPSQVLPNQNLFETEDSQTKPLPTFDAMNDNHQNLSSGFGERQHFNSPDSDDNPSCHMMGFSPLPRLPLWKTMEDISAPAMPVSADNGDRTQGAEGTSKGHDDGDHKRESPSRYDVTHSEPLLRDAHDNAGFINSTAISEGEFADLSDSLLNFANEDELLFMDVDGKDTIDRSCYDHLNSLLLSSPNDLQDGELNNIEPEASVVPSAGLATSSAPCLAESEDIASTIHADQLPVHQAEINVPSTSVLNPESIEHNDGNTCCTLNTEDPEIPCNDDIFLLIHPATSFAASAKQPITGDSIEPLSSSADEKDCEQGLNLMKGNDPAKSLTWPHTEGPNMLPESVPDHSLVGRAGKSELPDTKCRALLPGDAKKALRDPNQRRSTHATPTTDGLLEEDITKAELRVIDNPTTFREITSNAEAGSSKMTIPESVVKPSTSDQDEPESDNDVPYFSDIEAMILEMDLGPYDQEPYISKKVSRYQFEDSKRTIIRLEQCARSSLQRAMASQGALAILYGRHLKHYIRKTEVILGRSTDDIDVDIDLRKEGRANKISRRQAIIKMETDGSFSLKNLGKSSISVNGKVVATGQLLTLSSSCLIEIRGMSFVFEISHKSVRRCLDNNTEKSQGKMSKFEWVPEGES